MLQSWRIQLREAEEAHRSGRLDDAERLLRQESLQRCLPAKRLSTQVALDIAERGRRRLLAGESSAGWRDVETARSLSGESQEVLGVRRQMIDQAVSDAEAYLLSGESTKTIERLERLEKQGVSTEPMRVLAEVARRLESARNLSSRGRFEEADAQLTRAAALRPDLQVVSQRQQACRDRRVESRKLSEQLHREMVAENWSETLALADRLLEIVPDSPLAQDARKRAWKHVEGDRPSRGQFVMTQTWQPSQTRKEDSEDASPQSTGERMLLWIDGVGGFLTCLGSTVSLGQAAPGNHVDIPILGDLSRRVAKIHREEGYLIEPLQPIQVAGRLVKEVTLLSDGDEIELGGGVRVRFRQPHALSATARLDVASGHRTQPSSDGILLMADSCVLGPKWQDHVVCRDWENDVVLYRREGDLFCRAMDGLEIDGQYCEGQGRLGRDSHIAGSDFSLSLEPIA